MSEPLPSGHFTVDVPDDGIAAAPPPFSISLLPSESVMPTPSSSLLRLPAPVTGARRSRSTQLITMRQAINSFDAIQFAKSIDLPLVAHLTIHWSLTDIGDDPHGVLFAKVRECLSKWLLRLGSEFAGSWARAGLGAIFETTRNMNIFNYLKKHNFTIQLMRAVSYLAGGAASK